MKRAFSSFQTPTSSELLMAAMIVAGGATLLPASFHISDPDFWTSATPSLIFIAVAAFSAHWMLQDRKSLRREWAQNILTLAAKHASRPEGHIGFATTLPEFSSVTEWEVGLLAQEGLRRRRERSFATSMTRVDTMSEEVRRSHATVDLYKRVTGAMTEGIAHATSRLLAARDTLRTASQNEGGHASGEDPLPRSRLVAQMISSASSIIDEVMDELAATVIMLRAA